MELDDHKYDWTMIISKSVLPMHVYLQNLLQTGVINQ